MGDGGVCMGEIPWATYIRELSIYVCVELFFCWPCKSQHISLIFLRAGYLPTAHRHARSSRNPG
jgi:hypothetical protein